MSLPISFISDFGHDDEFVGVIHGVIAKLAPETRVIDLLHAVPRGNVRAAALALTRAIQYLPEGVALVVVDPGVGSSRAALALETEWGFFVGPDNGVLSPAVAMTGGATRIVSIENPEARIPSPGETFHGRDVFAPAAALLSSGEAGLADLGPDLPMDAVQPLLLPLPESQDGRVVGEAWWVDGFGNVEINIGPDELTLLGVDKGETVTVRVGASTYEVPWVTVYSDVGEGEMLLHVDSAGLLAVAVRSGSAADELNIGEGTTVTLEAPGSPTAG
jgi:S-adenosylmethionine hydrolase